jgi:hypothetical protein
MSDRAPLLPLGLRVRSKPEKEPDAGEAAAGGSESTGASHAPTVELDVFLDFPCPFSKRIFFTILDVLASPRLRKPENAGRVEVVFYQVREF